MHKPWTEKYRPKKLNEFVFSSPAHQELITSYITEKRMPCLLLVGPPGTGKTSLANVIRHELNIDRSDFKKINCSNQKTDTLRSTVADFAAIMPCDSDRRMVLLDEFDGIGHVAQDLLRAELESNTDTLFVATANRLSSISPALLSRMTVLELTAPDKDQTVNRANDVLRAEGVIYDPNDVEKIVSDSYPDVRKIIQELEKGSVSGKLKNIATNASVDSDVNVSIIKALMKGDANEARLIVFQSLDKAQYTDLYLTVFKYSYVFKQLEADIVILTEEYEQKNAISKGDSNLSLVAYFHKVSNLCRGVFNGKA